MIIDWNKMAWKMRRFDWIETLYAKKRLTKEEALHLAVELGLIPHSDAGQRNPIKIN